MAQTSGPANPPVPPAQRPAEHVRVCEPNAGTPKAEMHEARQTSPSAAGPVQIAYAVGEVEFAVGFSADGQFA